MAAMELIQQLMDRHSNDSSRVEDPGSQVLGYYLKDQFEIQSLFLTETRFVVATEGTLYEYKTPEDFRKNKVPLSIRNLECQLIERFNDQMITITNKNVKDSDILMLFSKDTKKIAIWFNSLRYYQLSHTKYLSKIFSQEQPLRQFDSLKFMNAQDVEFVEQQSVRRGILSSDRCSNRSK